MFEEEPSELPTFLPTRSLGLLDPARGIGDDGTLRALDEARKHLERGALAPGERGARGVGFAKRVRLGPDELRDVARPAPFVDLRLDAFVGVIVLGQCPDKWEVKAFQGPVEPQCDLILGQGSL
jgi:hypothetical protein